MSFGTDIPMEAIHTNSILRNSLNIIFNTERCRYFDTFFCDILKVVALIWSEIESCGVGL